MTYFMPFEPPRSDGRQRYECLECGVIHSSLHRVCWMCDAIDPSIVVTLQEKYARKQ